MNDKIRQIMAENEELDKIEVTQDEACISSDDSEKTKPGYTYQVDPQNYSIKHYYRYECTDDDVEAARLKIAFDVLKHTKRISFWVTLWSVLSIVGAAVLLITMLS